MLSTMPLPAKKKPSRSTQESGPQPNLLVHQGPPPHRQDRPILPAAPAPLGGAAKLMDGKGLASSQNLVGNLQIWLWAVDLMEANSGVRVCAACCGMSGTY